MTSTMKPGPDQPSRPAESPTGSPALGTPVEPATARDTPDVSAPNLAAPAAPASPPGSPPVAGPDDDPAASRRATRVADGAWLGGVSTGLAQHLGWPLMAIRVGFVLLLMTQFLGALIYGALWLLMPPDRSASAPGLESHERTGLRTTARSRRPADIGAVLALLVIAVGMIWLIQIAGLGLQWQVFWPILLACAGAALLWRQADAAQQRQWKDEVGGRTWLTPLVATGGWAGIVRILIGLILVGGAVGMVVLLQGNIQLLPQVLGMTGLALAGLLIVVAPLLHRTRMTLAQTREDKVRADARADMAAHLHDSVLQTLALIQRQSEDPKAVQQLARRQERELRTWLYGDEAEGGTLKAALADAAAEIEDERAVPIETIVVGDCELDPRLGALVRAAREAMMNAAKHSGAAMIDVYAEVTDEVVEVFVRDRGVGFDIDAIDEDRMGVRGSILDRMARHGGTATVRSSQSEPGMTGTEVRLEMSR
jgi:signal transduction histidine kinase/phage shock protein PspC (stress-responsive transcriptional regulator)